MKCTLDVIVAPMIAQSLTVLAPRLAQNANPLVLAYRFSFFVLLFQPKFVVLLFLVLVEGLLPLIGSTAYLTLV